MTDNLTVTSGANSTIPANTVIATDDVGSVHYQEVKLAIGADGAVDGLLDYGQSTMSASLPVAIASDQTEVPVLPSPPSVPAADEYWPVRLTNGSAFLSAAANLPVLEGGLTELIGIDEQVDASEYSASVSVALGGTYSGCITGILLVSSESGTGAVRNPYGTLMVFDANPSVSVGDTALSLAAARSLIGLEKVFPLSSDPSPLDAIIEANSGMVYAKTSIPFHEVSTLYFAFKNASSSWNDAAGDDEQLQFNFWIERKS